MAKRNASVCATIPEDLITEAIERQMVAAMGNKDDLVNAVVRAALTEKDRNSYDKETIFGKRLKEMIRSSAQAAFQEWLDKQGAKIAAAVKKQLDAKSGTFVDDLVEAIKSDAERTIRVSVQLQLPDCT